jgi:glycerol-3-phosphate acyltransferase PlsY
VVGVWIYPNYFSFHDGVGTSGGVGEMYGFTVLLGRGGNMVTFSLALRMEYIQVVNLWTIPPLLQQRLLCSLHPSLIATLAKSLPSLCTHASILSRLRTRLVPLIHALTVHDQLSTVFGVHTTCT